MNDFAKARNIAVGIMIFVYTYVIVQSHIFRGTAWSQFPLYVNNKALAFGSIILIALSYLPGPLARLFPDQFKKTLGLRKYFGLFGFGLAAIHAFISAMILDSGYFGRFFAQNGKMNPNIELSMLFGVLAFFIFLLVTIASMPGMIEVLGFDRWKKIQRSGYIAYFGVLLHVAAMGYASWLTPNTWPGKLLPLTLFAFIIIATTLLVRIGVLLLPKKK